MMTEVGGKLKAGLLVASVALFGVLAFSARTADIVKIKGEACEKFVPGQSKSSIRVRVTDKASYKAVSQVENLADVRSRMLEHDFNVIVYNLVDNYVRDLMVRTTSQNDKELCVRLPAPFWLRTLTPWLPTILPILRRRNMTLRKRPALKKRC